MGTSLHQRPALIERVLAWGCTSLGSQEQRGERTARMDVNIAAMTANVRRFSAMAVSKSESKRMNATSTRPHSALSMTQCSGGSTDAAMPPRREFACMHARAMLGQRQGGFALGGFAHGVKAASVKTVERAVQAVHLQPAYGMYM